MQQQAKAAEQAAEQARQQEEAERNLRNGLSTDANGSGKRDRDAMKATHSGPGGAVNVVAASRPDTYHEAWNKDIKTKTGGPDANGNGDNSNTTVASSAAANGNASSSSSAQGTLNDGEFPEGVTPKVVKKKKLSHMEVPTVVSVGLNRNIDADGNSDNVDPDATPGDDESDEILVDENIPPLDREQNNHSAMSMATSGISSVADGNGLNTQERVGAAAGRLSLDRDQNRRSSVDGPTTPASRMGANSPAREFARVVDDSDDVNLGESALSPSASAAHGNRHNGNAQSAGAGGNLAPLVLEEKRHEVDAKSMALHQKYVEEGNPVIAAALRKISERIISALVSAKELGKVVIVTNAETGWIELSCKAWLPAAYGEVMSCQLISARSTYEPTGVGSPAGEQLCL